MTVTSDLWLVAVAYRGVIEFVQGCCSREDAERSLFKHLRHFHNYRGQRSIKSIEAWLEDHTEDFSVELRSQKVPRLISTA